MAIGFSAKVERTYVLEGRRVLILEHGYRGDVEVGDWVDVGLPSGADARVRVATVAWGSAFHADDPPLTLVVSGLSDETPQRGAHIKGAPAPAGS